MNRLTNLQGRKSAQLELPFGLAPRTVGQDGKRGLPHQRARPRPANDSDPFASSTYPTRGVFNGVGNGRRHAKRKIVSLDLSDLDARVGPGADGADCYGE